MSEGPPCWKVVLTGGPCAGKTTALARLIVALRDFGYKVYTVPEAASIMFLNGVSVHELGDSDFRAAMQRAILDIQINLEDGLERVARASGRPAILLCDRGLMDGAAYMEGEEWPELLDAANMDTGSCREARYDAVLHLVTAASGAEAFYSLGNNAARTESPDMARLQDGKTLAVWLGHPRLYVFDNSTGFDEKMDRVIRVISRLVGLPSSLSAGGERYLLKQAPESEKLPLDWQGFDVEKIFLQNGEPPVPPSNDLRDGSSPVVAKTWYRYITKRTSEEDKFSSYGVTSRVEWSDGSHSEHIRAISEREYGTLRQLADPNRAAACQRRICFVWDNQSFVLTTYRSPSKGLCLLNAHAVGVPGSKIRVPPFLGDYIEKSVRDRDEAYSAHFLCARHH